MRRCKIRPDAVAVIRGGSSVPQLFGKISFFQKCGSVLVVAEISGLPQDSETGFFGLHVHEGYGCGGDAFSQTGSHYNPENEEHPRHFGDLPPLLLCQAGAYLCVRTDRFSVKDVIGCTVVIHSGADDFQSQPSGKAGEKIGCGVIHKIREM